MRSIDLVIAHELVVLPDEHCQLLLEALDKSQLQIALLVIHALEGIRLALLRTEECKDSVLGLTEELSVDGLSGKDDLSFLRKDA